MAAQPRIVHKDLEECLEHCWQCHRLCLETAIYLLALEEEADAKQEKVRLLLSCAEICQSTANLLLLGAGVYQQACKLCADLCEQCAGLFGPDLEDRQMQLCFDACCRCAASCQKMAGMFSADLCATLESDLERELRRERQRDKVDEASWQSFPASDPPAY